MNITNISQKSRPWLSLGEKSYLQKDGEDVWKLCDDTTQNVIVLMNIASRYTQSGNTYLSNDSFFSCPVIEFEFQVKTQTQLRSADIEYMGELIQRTEQELRGTHNLTTYALKDIKELLALYGFVLGVWLEGWVRPDSRWE